MLSNPLQAHLNQLVEADVLEALVAAEASYQFRHVFLQAVAYDTLLKTDQRQLHLIVGSTLEKLYPAQLTELAPVLARHYELGKNLVKARHYFVLAGDTALAHYANEEAETHYSAALAITEEPLARAPLQAQMGEVLFRRSRFQEAMQCWRAAIDLYQEAKNLDQVAFWYSRLARAEAWPTGGTAASLALCREGLRWVQAGAETPGLAALLHETARASLFTGVTDKALTFAREALTVAQRLQLVELQADILATLGMALRTSQPLAAVATLQQAVTLAEQANRLMPLQRAHNNLAIVLDEVQGDLAAARLSYQRALAFTQRRGSPAEELFVLANLVNVWLWQGALTDVETALPHLQVLLAASNNTAARPYLVQFVQARCLGYQGQWGAAQQLLQQAQAHAQQRGDIHALGYIYYTLGDFALEMSDWPAAAQAWQASLDIGDRNLGYGPVWPRCMLSAAWAQQDEALMAQRLLTEAHVWAGSTPTPRQQPFLAYAAAHNALVNHQWTNAWAAFAAATQAWATQGLRWYQARALTQWAKALHQHGAPAQARTHWQAALALYAALPAPHYVQAVQTALNQLP